jgi:hypothetical protein
MSEDEMITSSIGHDGGGAAARADEWPQVWFTLAQHQWQTLALVPAHSSMSVLLTARALVAAARLYEEPSIALVEAENIAPPTVREIVAFVRDRTASGGRTIVAVASPLNDHGAVPIARACDACVLILPLGKTALRDARETIDRIGRGTFLGAITAPGPKS